MRQAERPRRWPTLGRQSASQSTAAGAASRVRARSRPRPAPSFVYAARSTPVQSNLLKTLIVTRRGLLGVVVRRLRRATPAASHLRGCAGFVALQVHCSGAIPTAPPHQVTFNRVHVCLAGLICGLVVLVRGSVAVRRAIGVVVVVVVVAATPAI